MAISNGSLIDASSRAEGGQRLENIAGTINLVNHGPPIHLQDSALLARSGPALDAANKDHIAGSVSMFNKGYIAIDASRVDARADATRSPNLKEGALIQIQSGQNEEVTIAGPFPDATTLVESEGRIQEYNFLNIVGLKGRVGTPTPFPIVDEAPDSLERFNRLFQDQVIAQLGPTSPFNLTGDAASPVVPESVFVQPLHVPGFLERAGETAVAITTSLNQDALGAALSGWQQRTLAATAKQLGLSPGVGKLRSIEELRQRLGQASSLSPRARLGSYVPAILNLQRDDQSPGSIRLTAILLTAQGEPRSSSVDLPRATFDGWIRSFQRQLSRRAPSSDAGSNPAVKIADALLSPFLPVLREGGITALLVEADRGLQAIPYAALPLDGRPLADAVALTITPSLGLIDLEPQRLARPSLQGQMLLAGASAFRNGLESLPMVRQELQALAAEHPSTLLLDGGFTPASLKQAALAPGVRQLHIATHANFLPGQASNGLLYTPSTSLSLAELGQSLRSRASASPLELLSLSGCLTALGDERSELGFVGMALQAGALSGLGTLWEVDDAATAAFYIQFYRHLKQGLPKDQALQATQRSFLRREVRLQGDRLVGPNPNAANSSTTLVSGLSAEQQTLFAQGLDHPYYWAGMVLSGSPW